MLQKDECGMQDIRWYSLLAGEREPTCDTFETTARISEAKKLLTHLFGRPFEECLKTLVDNEENATFLVNNVPRLQRKCAKLNKPAIEALLAFKDRLRIPDHDWSFVVETFDLGADASLHHIRKLRTTTNNELGVETTLGGRGAEYDITKLLTYLLEKNPPKDPTKVCVTILYK